MANFARAAATTARLWFGASLRTATGAGLAGDRGGDANLRGFAAERFVQRYFHSVAQIGSALAARATAASRAHTENAFKDVGKGGAEIGAKSVPTPHAAMFECGMAKSVVGSALVAIFEDVVRLIDFLKAVLAILVALIAVWVVLHGELAERSLELNLSAGAGNAENLV